MARAALKQRGSLQIWFDPKTVWLAEPGGKRGRPATIADVAIQAYLALQARCGLPSRQTAGLVESLLQLAGPDWSVPDVDTLSRRSSGLDVVIRYLFHPGPAGTALHLPIDSTKIKAGGEGVGFAWETRAFQAAPVAESASWD